MSTYEAVLSLVVAANVALLGLVALRANRRVPRTALIAALAFFATTHAMAVGRTTGAIGPSGDALAFASLLIAHASVAIFVVLFLHGEPLRRRTPFLVAIGLAGFGLAGLGIAQGWHTQDVFQPVTDPGRLAVNAYLVACLAVALAESLAAWRRSVVLRRESFLLMAGTIALIVAGPIYGFELVAINLTEFLGTNLASPLAGALFAGALLRMNPLRFRGRGLEGAPAVPWKIPPGVYLVEEARPKFARAMLLAARHAPALAVVSEANPTPELAGVEKVRLPPGERCAAVLASTASEFLFRYPTGSVLVDDLSYVVAHSGLDAAREAVARVAEGLPARGRLVVSMANLTEDERESVARIRATRVQAPGLEAEVAAVLEAHLGASAGQLQRAATAQGKRAEDLGVTDLPWLRDYFVSSLRMLQTPADEAVHAGWGRVAEALAADLDRLWRTAPTEPRPRPAAAKPVMPEKPLEEIVIVHATDVPDLTPPKTDRRPPPAPLGAALREAFLGSLGPAGDSVFRRVLTGLRKEPEAVRWEDLPKVARLAEEAVADLGSAIDVDEARRDFFERARRLRLKLDGLAREAR